MSIEDLDGKTLQTRYGLSRLSLGQYPNGRPAITLFIADGEEGAGEAIATLTVNIPGVQLGPDEIIVKTWSENLATAALMLKTGWFKDTGRRVPTGFVQAEIWKVLV